MKRSSAMIGILVCLTAARAADAPIVLTFDESFTSGYGGLEWSNFGVLDASVRPVTEGYHIGMISPKYVAYNAFGDPAAIGRSAGFTLNSAYLTSALDVRSGLRTMHIRVRGSVGTNVTYDNTYTINNTAPALINFNYVGIDRVIFVASPGSPFAMDDLTVTVPPRDGSCTFVIAPRSRLHGFGAETGAVSVITQAGCTWNVINTNSWITILSGLSSSGSGTVTYSVTAEPDGLARTGFLNIAGQSFAVSQANPAPVGVELLTFDDLLPLPSPIQNTYGGLQWDNFGVLDASVQRGTLGYRASVVSADNIAFNRYGDPAWISSSHSFDFRSAYLTAAIDITNYSITVRVQGFAGPVLLYDNAYTLGNHEPAFISFDYRGVDLVTFVPSQHSTIFAMDNVVVVVDSDGDGVLDDEDQCPDTAPGTPVDVHGCSIAQLAPCGGPLTGGAWRNHAEYIKAVAAVADEFLSARIITAGERNATVRAAAQSNCGKK